MNGTCQIVDTIYYIHSNGSIKIDPFRTSSNDYNKALKEIAKKSNKNCTHFYLKNSQIIFDKETFKTVRDSVQSIKYEGKNWLLVRNETWEILGDQAHNKYEEVKMKEQYLVGKPSTEITLYQNNFTKKILLYRKSFDFITSELVVYEFDGQKYLYNLQTNKKNTLKKYVKYEYFNDSLLLVTNEQGLKGIIDYNNNNIIPTEYITIERDTLSFYKLSRKKEEKIYQGICNERGRFIVMPVYEKIGKLKNKLYTVYQNGKWGFVDINGKELIKPFFEEVSTFRNQVCAVKLDKKWGIIDRGGKWVQFPIYDDLVSFNDSIWIWSKEYAIGLYYINTKTEKIFNQYQELFPLSENFIRVKANDKYGVINLVGKTILKPEFEKVVFYESENIFITSKKDYYSIYYPNGNLKVFMNYPLSRFDHYQEGMALIVHKGKFGFIDKDGLLLISTQYDDARAFKNGIAAVKIGNNWGYINKKEKFIVNPYYEQVRDFSGLTSAVYKNGKWGIVDQNGRETISPQYDEINTLESGNYIVKVKNKYGIVNKSGIEVISPIYNYIEELSPNVFKVRMTNLYELLNENGKKIVTDKYNEIYFDKKFETFVLIKTSEWEPL
jgi:hypothetical protein